jgi:hypothetical protein
MAHLHRSAATLRVAGDALDPKEITRLLGCAPTDCHMKGEVKQSKHRDIVRKTGMWSLQATDRQPEDLDAQVAELLSQLTPDLSVWTSLSRQFEINLFCGFFMQETDEGVDISAKTLKALGDRGIKLGLCLYAPVSNDHDVAA